MSIQGYISFYTNTNNRWKIVFELIKSLGQNVEYAINNDMETGNCCEKEFYIQYKQPNGNDYKIDFQYILLNKKESEYKYQYTLWNITPPDESELYHTEYKGK